MAVFLRSGWLIFYRKVWFLLTLYSCLFVWCGVRLSSGRIAPDSRSIPKIILIRCQNSVIIKLLIYYFLNILSNWFISSLISLPLSLILQLFLIIGITHQDWSPIKIIISIIRSNVPVCTFFKSLFSYNPNNYLIYIR